MEECNWNKELTEAEKWQVRRFRHLSHYGINPERVGEQLYFPRESCDSVASSSSSNMPSRASRTLSYDIERDAWSSKRESAIKIIFNAITSTFKRRCSSQDFNRKASRMQLPKSKMDSLSYYKDKTAGENETNLSNKKAALEEELFFDINPRATNLHNDQLQKLVKQNLNIPNFYV